MGWSGGGVGGDEDWTSFVLSSVCAYLCVIMSACLSVCTCAQLWEEILQWRQCRGNAKEAHASREGGGGGGTSEQERRRGSGGGGGVNFDMSFLKLSFDNWQFVQLVKCQESKKIDEVHNRCLRLTLRCGLESHARIRPPKRYRNKIPHAHTHTHTVTHTRKTNTQTDAHNLDGCTESTSDMENWSTSI